MVFSSKEIIGGIASVVFFLATWVYIKAIIKGRVSSNKVSWGIWILVMVLACGSYYQANGFSGAFLVLFANLVGVIVVFTTLCIYAKTSVWTAVEKISLLGCIIVFSLWIFYSAVTIMTLTLLIDIFGFLPLAVSVFKCPKGEYAVAWYLGFLSNAINLFAVEAWDYPHAAYPIYLFFMTLSVSILVRFPKLLR